MRDYKVFTRFLIPCLVLTAPLSGSQQEFMHSPQFWTGTVATINPYEADGGEEIPINFELTLHRIEAGMVIATAGRHGSVKVPIELTDFSERFYNLKNGTIKKASPLLISRIGNKCFLRYPGPRYEGLPIKYFEGTTTVLLLFASGEAEIHNHIIGRFSKYYTDWKACSHGFEVIMIQTDGEVFNCPNASKITWPTMVLYMSLAYKDAMQMQQAAPPSFVIAGAEGNIIYKSNTLNSGNLDEELKHVEDLLKRTNQLSK